MRIGRGRADTQEIGILNHADIDGRTADDALHIGVNGEQCRARIRQHLWWSDVAGIDLFTAQRTVVRLVDITLKGIAVLYQDQCAGRVHRRHKISNIKERQQRAQQCYDNNQLDMLQKYLQQISDRNLLFHKFLLSDGITASRSMSSIIPDDVDPQGDTPLFNHYILYSKERVYYSYLELY